MSRMWFKQKKLPKSISVTDSGMEQTQLCINFCQSQFLQVRVQRWSEHQDMSGAVVVNVSYTCLVLMYLSFASVLWCCSAGGGGSSGKVMTRSPSAIKQMLLDWCKAMTREYEVYSGTLHWPSLFAGLQLVHGS